MIQEAYNQISLYRDELRDPGTSLWKHIVFGSFQDLGLWATGACCASTIKIPETYIGVFSKWL
jgi:hypothetical protein